MPASTRFLSKLIGLYFLIVSVVMLLHRQDIVGTVQALVHDRPLMFITGVVTLFGGLAMVLVHNRWSGSVATVVVTVLGWMTLLKGISWLALTPDTTADFYLGTLHYADLYYVYAGVVCVIGAYLGYVGFVSKDV